MWPLCGDSLVRFWAHRGQHRTQPEGPAADGGVPEGDYGKHAVTHYDTVEPLGYVSVVKCVLETGRTHQIRVHMKHIGHPFQ